MINTRLIKKVKNSQKYIILTILFNLISLFASIVGVFSFAVLLNSLFEKTYTNQLLIKSIALIIGMIIIKFICNLLISKTSYLSSKNVKVTLRQSLYKKLLRLGVSYNEFVSTSEAIQVGVEGIEQLEIFFGSYLPQLIYSLLAPLILFVVLSFISIKAAIILLIGIPLIPISIIIVQKIAKKLLNKYWKTYTTLGDSFLENIQGLTTLKIYQADESKQLQMDKESETFRKVTMRVLTMQLNSISVMDLIAYGGAAIGITMGILELSKGNINFIGAFLIIMLSAEFFIPLRLLGSYFHIAMNGMAASNKLFSILDLEEPNKGSEVINNIKIEFKDLNFSYDQERTVLEKINFIIKENQYVAFVGESGSGKSTIASLIVGTHLKYDGNILIDDKEIKTLSEASVMDNITIVSHNSYIFKGTVKENLLMGKNDATIEQLNDVLHKVNLYDFLYSLQGLETQLLEKGSNLSGGQQQRLALARALLHDSRVYIFDEATSNIDADSETLIMNVIEELSLTKTIILISHRMANVVKADCIYVLDKGMLIEKGSHQELINQEGQYQKIFNNQKALEQYSYDFDGDKL